LQWAGEVKLVILPTPPKRKPPEPENDEAPDDSAPAEDAENPAPPSEPLGFLPMKWLRD
jgi:hypothetical protein